MRHPKKKGMDGQKVHILGIQNFLLFGVDNENSQRQTK